MKFQNLPFGKTNRHKALYKWTKKGTIEALTGPVLRGDDNTVLKHLNVLSDEDKLLYMLLSRKILKVAKAKNKDFDYTKIEKIINNNFE